MGKYTSFPDLGQVVIIITVALMIIPTAQIKNYKEKGWMFMTTLVLVGLTVWLLTGFALEA